MPQPLSRVKPDADIRVRAAALPPKFCVYITRTITAWAYNDHLLANMLCGFLNAEYEVVAAMYQSLVSGEARRAALYAAAKAAVPQHLNLIIATIQSTKVSREERNHFAHHIWAISEQLPDAMILVDPATLTEPDVKLRAMAEKGLLKPTITPVGNLNRIDFPPMPVLDRSKMMVYREKDFKDAATNAETCSVVFQALMRATNRTAPDEQERQLLLGEPRIARALARLSPESAPSTPETPPQETDPQ